MLGPRRQASRLDAERLGGERGDVALKAVRSGITEPTTMPSRSAGRRPGTESKHALPASQMRSRYVALRTPKRVMPAPTRATSPHAVTLLSAAVPGARPSPYRRAAAPAARGRA